MHEFALGGMVYGFAYDDVYGQDSTLAGPIGLASNGDIVRSKHGNVVSLAITIPNFTAPDPPAPPGADLTVQAEIATSGTCGPTDISLTEGLLVHFTTSDGVEGGNAYLDATGKAVVKGVKANQQYTAYIVPAGPNYAQWQYSYAPTGRYDGTTGGTWSSSHDPNSAGVIRLQIGRLVPGTGSCMSPQPNDPGPGSLPPLPTSGSNQTSWGNL